MDNSVNGITRRTNSAVRHEAVHKASVREERLQILVDCVSDLIVRISRDGTLLYASPASSALIGINNEHLRGRNIYELIHSADCDRVRRVLQDPLESRDIPSCEFRMRHMNGDAVWIEMRAQHAECNVDGELVAVLRDITARHRDEVLASQLRRRLEEQVDARSWQLETTVELLRNEVESHKRDMAALEQSEKRYTTLAENTLTGIYIHDGRNIVYCNERFARIFGYDSEAIKNMNTDDMFASKRALETLLSGMENEEVVEGVASGKKTIWLKISRARMESGNQMLVLGNVIDITEQVVMNERLKVSEKELHALSAQLITAQEMERKRIANELHDGIGQRLSAIKFSVENVCRTVNVEIEPEQARRLNGIVETIRDTIEEIRRVSMDLRPSVLDDLGLIATIGWFTREFGTHFPDITVSRNIDISENDLLPEMKVVIFRIMQEAFHNITKHAKADEITLELLKRDDVLSLIIRDNGQGMACCGQLPCAGGLGLKSMRERAELTHGEFSIDSSEGNGTTIRVMWSLVNNQIGPK